MRVGEPQLCGECVQSGDDSALDATVEIFQNTPDDDVFGGYVPQYYSQQASGNKVTLQPGSAAKNVYGGHSQDGNASENTVILSGSATVTGAVYGGYAASGGDALNNRVIIQGNPNLTGSMLYGGSSTGAGLSAGNVLEIHSTGLTAQNVSAFQEIHFILPANTAANTTVLTLNGGVTPQATNLRGVKVGVGIKAGGNVLQNGDRVTLIHNAQGIDTDATIAQADVSGYQGVSLKYTFGLSADATNVYATAKTDAVVMEQTKAPVEG